MEAFPWRTSVDAAFVEVIRTLRTGRGPSKEALEHAIDSGRTYISELERGVKGASLTMVFRLAEALHARPAELVRRAEALTARG